MLQIAQSQCETMSMLPYETGIIHVDENGLVVSLNGTAANIVAACPDVFDLDAHDGLVLRGKRVLGTPLNGANDQALSGPQHVVVYSKASQTNVVLHILPRPDGSTSIIVFTDANARASIRDRLTPREMDILVLAAKGLRRDRMAYALGICVATVDLHCANLRKKMRAKTTSEAVAMAITQYDFSRECIG